MFDQLFTIIGVIVASILLLLTTLIGIYVLYLYRKSSNVTQLHTMIQIGLPISSNQQQ